MKLAVVAALCARTVGAGHVAWYDEREALHFGSAAAAAEAQALGAWAVRLGAPAAEGGAAGLPVADVLRPLARLTLFVVPAAELPAPAALAGTDVLGSLADVAFGLRTARRTATIACVGKAVCGSMSRKDATSAASREALTALIVAAGGEVSEKRIRAGADAAWFPLKDVAQQEFFAELAMLVHVSREEAGVKRVDVLTASKFTTLAAADRAAALALVHAAARGVASAATVGVVTVDPSAVTRRRLDVASGTKYYSLEQVREYQLGLWSAIALVAVLFSAVMALATMKPEYDSLLYCTFQANVNNPGKMD
ncbi:hypothetical protein M885DRAFT_547644 [Pelagophyceae sp. CCMP2097]|nr:hypothetical protein M885DRAFT_547644 [Pelagophyceae sp. CCMP2097]